MPSPEVIQQRLDEGEKEAMANHLAHFILGVTYYDNNLEKPVSYELACKNWRILEDVAYALLNDRSKPYTRMELATPSGKLTHAYKRPV